MSQFLLLSALTEARKERDSRGNREEEERVGTCREETEGWRGTAQNAPTSHPSKGSVKGFNERGQTREKRERESRTLCLS